MWEVTCTGSPIRPAWIGRAGSCSGHLWIDRDCPVLYFARPPSRFPLAPFPLPQILVERLAKTYRVTERDPGVLGAVRGLFHRRRRIVEALTDVSFSLERGEL